MAFCLYLNRIMQLRTPICYLILPSITLFKYLIVRLMDFLVLFLRG